MKTSIHFVLILLFAVILGFALRFVLSSTRTAGPGPDDQVFTNDLTTEQSKSIGAGDIAKASITRPPDKEDWLSRFELTERNGKTVTSEELLGQPYVVSFFFTTCPSVCIRQNQKLKELQDEFEGQGVRFVAISVDPETDTPEQLREYAARFGADEEQWLFMTGDLTYIRRVGAEVFRLPVDKKFHTERFVLVDPDGKVEGMYSWPDKRQFKELKAKIAEMQVDAEKES